MRCIKHRWEVLKIIKHYDPWDMSNLRGGFNFIACLVSAVLLVVMIAAVITGLHDYFGNRTYYENLATMGLCLSGIIPLGLTIAVNYFGSFSADRGCIRCGKMDYSATRYEKNRERLAFEHTKHREKVL